MNDFSPSLPGLSVQHDRASLKWVRDHRNALEKEGFVHIAGADMRGACGEVGGMERLLEAANQAPGDAHSNGLRRRYYRTATLQPWSGSLRFDDCFIDPDGRSYVPYYQSSGVNADQGGKERRFDPLPNDLEANPLLRALIYMLFSVVPGQMIEQRLPVRVGIHLIRLMSDGRRIALPSPNCLHTDGEPWTAIILIDRWNVTQTTARNFVARRQCKGAQPQDVNSDDILAAVTMTEALETIMIDDARVAHSVSGCLGIDGNVGWRSSLLIDFSPMYPERTT